jgi:hypothetical protein
MTAIHRSEAPVHAVKSSSDPLAQQGACRATDVKCSNAGTNK